MPSDGLRENVYSEVSWKQNSLLVTEKNKKSSSRTQIYRFLKLMSNCANLEGKKYASAHYKFLHEVFPRN